MRRLPGTPARAPAAVAGPGAGAPPACRTGRRVLFVAVNTRAVRQVCDDAAYLLARGVGVDLLVVDPVPWEGAGLPEEVHRWSLRVGEGRHPLPRVERLLVFRAPRRALALLRAAAARHFGHPDYGRPLELGVGLLERGHARAAGAFHHRVFIRGYRVVRPYLLWRVARRAPGRELVRGGTERVVVCDSYGVPTAWRLARAHPHLEVSLGLDRTAYADLPAAEPAAEPATGAAQGPAPEPVPGAAGGGKG